MIQDNSIVRIYHPDKSGGFWPEHNNVGLSKFMPEGFYRVDIIHPIEEKGHYYNCSEKALTVLSSKEIIELNLVGIDEGTIVPCGGCGKSTPYFEPYNIDEQLCDDCIKIVSQMQKDGEL